MLERTNYDASFRCSTHMHINMLDFTVNQIARFLLVYAACEPIIFQFCGKYRKTSNFCTTVADSMPFHKKLISRLYDDTVQSRYAAQSTVKYTALNLQPLFGDGRHTAALGTVEFRGGRALTTLNEFTTLANLLLSIKDFVRTFEGNEDAMLARLSDGVMNTVYANGCAAGLEAPLEEMENAMIHSWILLKSYQQGMSRKPEAKIKPSLQDSLNSYAARASSPRASMDWGNPGEAAQNARATSSEIARMTFSCSGAAGPNADRIELPQYTPEEWPSLHHNMELLLDPRVSIGAKYARSIQAVRDPAFRGRINMINATIALFRWQLEASDSGYVYRGYPYETDPVNTMRRAVERYQRNIPEGVHAERPLNRQPQFNPGMAQTDYRRLLGQAAWDDLLTNIGHNTAIMGNVRMYDWLLYTKVRVKNRGLLQTALQTVGVEYDFEQYGEYMQVVHLMYLLKFTGKASSDHVFRSNDNLATYDRIAYVVETLTNAGCSVPVWKSQFESGRGLVRLEENFARSYCGYGSVEQRHFAQERRTERRPSSVIQRHMVY